jgi:hypothetical protein
MTETHYANVTCIYQLLFCALKYFLDFDPLVKQFKSFLLDLKLVFAIFVIIN